MAPNNKKDQASTSNRDRERSQSPLGESSARTGGTFTREDLMEMMSQTMSAQIPRLILETSKVVTEQLACDQQDTVRSFTTFSQEMKKMKLRQEEVSAQGKAGALRSEGGLNLYYSAQLIPFISVSITSGLFRSLHVKSAHFSLHLISNTLLIFPF